MLFELRQYRTKPGQRDCWVKFMDEVIIPTRLMPTPRSVIR
jgi:hypothetical protein